MSFFFFLQFRKLIRQTWFKSHRCLFFSFFLYCRRTLGIYGYECLSPLSLRCIKPSINMNALIYRLKHLLNSFNTHTHRHIYIYIYASLSLWVMPLPFPLNEIKKKTCSGIAFIHWTCRKGGSLQKIPWNTFPLSTIHNEGMRAHRTCPSHIGQVTTENCTGQGFGKEEGAHQDNRLYTSRIWTCRDTLARTSGCRWETAFL